MLYWEALSSDHVRKDGTITRWLAALPGLLVIAGCGNAAERPKTATAVESTDGGSSVHRGQGGAAGSTGVSRGGVGQDAGAGQGASYGEGGNFSVTEGGSPEQAAGSDSGVGGSPADSSLFAPEVAIRSPESVAEFEEQSPVRTIGNLDVVCRVARASHPNAREVNSSTIGIEREGELGARAPEDQEGWICLAARAEDNAGNIGVSRPLRLCLDRTDPDHPETLACVVDDAPTCTAGCTLLDSFDYSGDGVFDLLGGATPPDLPYRH